MKIAAFDFDGTILFDSGIPDPTLEAIHRWQDAGHLAVAATGKSLKSAEFTLQDYDIAFDYSVLFTGAVVAKGHHDILYEKYLDTDMVEQVIDMLSTVQGISCFGTRLRERDTRFLDTQGSDTDTPILVDYEDMSTDGIPHHQFIGIPIWVPGDDALRQRLVDMIRSSFDCECVTNQDFIDIIPAGCTKGTGLAWLSTHLGVPRSEVELYTFGDSFNDLAMHEVADESFSFTWSPEEVRKRTTNVVTGVEKPLDELR
ncbi:MAG: Cof-type HAD-IIB family hydrolase [Corynebacterium glucuronolyticum]|nr:Cof-type HAD-IIB family hydrolase [Corynebacterium glucuronolyticum]